MVNTAIPLRQRSTPVNRSRHWTVRKGRSGSCAAKYWGGDSIGLRISPQRRKHRPPKSRLSIDHSRVYFVGARS